MAGQRACIRFLHRGEVREIGDFPATRTVLDWLREEEGLTGTKEGCAEGDCGACTVLLGRANRGEIRYEAVNACIVFLGALDGRRLVTVEELAGPDGALTPSVVALTADAMPVNGLIETTGQSLPKQRFAPASSSCRKAYDPLSLAASSALSA